MNGLLTTIANFFFGRTARPTEFSPAELPATASGPLAAAPTPYNNKRPFVVVDIKNDELSRGDTHGYVGIAQRIAGKLDADYLFLDEPALENLYPGIPDHDSRLLRLFKDRGYPDFLFAAHLDYTTHDAIEANSCCVLVKSYNEHLRGCIGGTVEEILSRPSDIVPHHLSPEKLRHEGNIFAREYSDLPRPFIGVNIVEGYSDGFQNILDTLVRLARNNPVGQATFFVSSCYRTQGRDYGRMVEYLKKQLGEDASFPLIDFDYSHHMRNYGPEWTWNPYAGMLDQCEHLVVLGNSSSILSECLATGKQVHAHGNCYSARLYESAMAKYPGDYKEGETFTTSAIPPVDITDEIADKLIKGHARLVETVSSEDEKTKTRFRAPRPPARRGLLNY